MRRKWEDVWLSQLWPVSSIPWITAASQLLGYHTGAPTLRPEITFAVYRAFPELRAKLREGAGQGLGGFSG